MKRERDTRRKNGRCRTQKDVVVVNGGMKCKSQKNKSGEIKREGNNNIREREKKKGLLFFRTFGCWRGAAGAAGEEQKKPVKNEKAVLRFVVLWWCRYCDTSNGTPAADEETLLGSHPTASAVAAETKLSSRRYTGRWTCTSSIE